MGVMLGQVGVLQTVLWAESAPSQAIHSRFEEGERRWELTLWVDASQYITGRCGWGLWKRSVRGFYMPGDMLVVRVGSRLGGHTLRLNQNGMHISGRIGGIVTGCEIDVDAHQADVCGWLRSSPWCQQQIMVQWREMDVLLAVMIGALACYWGYVVNRWPEMS
ncbi:MAG: hypothetical protein C7B44_08625 [Sulfobacillus thermosulfidooxidans]|uniref:Uncharacterized protein n=1 Tax=Sulfobacillus thermotolerans TaxID=338644 RepID=A0ABM6RVE8_9FIRM|nr:hypothetical protein [Sulfobacillus sp. hq2]AUW95231.1 hypothetical protein BXT84_15740 [Sulfobacillus thermotolerans]MCY0908670.1 hypothetical protein [Sulfobacillus thermotolerans]POB10521.1 hypothetical protein CO251_09425 [Sulfobacillus sp. hq2]PSR36515.1 MAG: hypothetical protein C7B44_08625 [Sulfobacillus thermosulfidooxidans]